MGLRIGLVAGNGQTAVDVAVLAASAGAQVVSWLSGADQPESSAGNPGEPIALLVADIEGAGELVAADQEAIRRTAEAGLPVVLVHRHGQREAAQSMAARVAAGHVVELPGAAVWLGEQIGPVPSVARLAVIGATGGAGATTVAIACALGADAECLLIDADPWSAGLDLPLGIPDDSGARWASIPDATAPLVVDSVRAALPTVAGVTVLTGSLPDPMGARLGAVLEVGRIAFPRTVVDLGRDPSALPGALVDGVVVTCPATLPGVVSTQRLLGALPPVRTLVAVRPSGWLPVEQVAEQLGGVPIVEIGRLARVGELADCADLVGGRTGRTLRRLGQRIWSELA